mmetsp:Transcript_6034/g.9121  ORF Transcript_6034/g.9121 Transcript_6034/m.9121 type:complete len:297 (-) Transcript_6034:348-1238(-)
MHASSIISPRVKATVRTVFVIGELRADNMSSNTDADLLRYSESSEVADFRACITASRCQLIRCKGNARPEEECIDPFACPFSNEKSVSPLYFLNVIFSSLSVFSRILSTVDADTGIALTGVKKSSCTLRSICPIKLVNNSSLSANWSFSTHTGNFWVFLSGQIDCKIDFLTASAGVFLLWSFIIATNVDLTSDCTFTSADTTPVTQCSINSRARQVVTAKSAVKSCSRDLLRIFFRQGHARANFALVVTLSKLNVTCGHVQAISAAMPSNPVCNSFAYCTPSQSTVLKNSTIDFSS